MSEKINFNEALSAVFGEGKEIADGITMYGGTIERNTLMENWQSRVIGEARSLEEKLIRLIGYIETNSNFNLLDKEEAFLLRLQRIFMEGYRDVLHQRIKLFREQKKKEE